MYVENTQETFTSSADYKQLRAEAWTLFQRFGANSTAYPQLALLSAEHEATLDSCDLWQMARDLGRDAKIPLIKEIRRRYSDNSGKCIGLKEAKYLADSIFRDLGW